MGLFSIKKAKPKPQETYEVENQEEKKEAYLEENPEEEQEEKKSGWFG